MKKIELGPFVISCGVTLFGYMMFLNIIWEDFLMWEHIMDYWYLYIYPAGSFVCASIVMIGAAVRHRRKRGCNNIAVIYKGPEAGDDCYDVIAQVGCGSVWYLSGEVVYCERCLNTKGD